MKKLSPGYTLIEVTLFLGLSGFLIIALISSTNASISSQRYNDSVYSVSDFLRGIYSEVLNVSNDKIPSSMSGSENAGRSKTAVYGKLLVFDESMSDGSNGAPVYTDTVNSYDVVGTAVSASKIIASNTLDILREVGANIIYDADTSASGSSHDWKFYRVSSFNAPWEATIEHKNDGTSDGKSFRQMILIVRSPVSGTVHTYLSNEDLSAAGITSYPRFIYDLGAGHGEKVKTDFQNLLRSSVFKETQIDMCVDSDDLRRNDNRRDIRISAYAANSSGVSMVAQDDLYDFNTNPKGSFCEGKG